MLAPTEIAKTPLINAAIAEVIQEFSSYVRHIRYEIAPDWTGEWTITFRVLISDEAARKRNRHDITAGVRSRMTDLIVPALGVIPDFWFRSESEQKKLNEPAWAWQCRLPMTCWSRRITWRTGREGILSRPASGVLCRLRTTRCFISSSRP